MKKFIFILGGVRSGKSDFATKLAKKMGGKVAFVATGVWLDKEMQERIKWHKSLRPAHWKVIEEAIDLESTLVNIKNKFDVVIVDCLGGFVSNLLLEGIKDNKIRDRLAQLVKVLLQRKVNLILVSNEVGSGIVPDNPLARRFRDLVGLANQMMAKAADEVYLLQAGIPIKIKNAKFKI